MKYKIKRLCFDSNLGVPPYEDNPTETFDTFEDAWDFIVKLAEEEVEYLNEDCHPDVSFGVSYDYKYEKKELCQVDYYYTPEDDCTGNTEIVTQYWVYSVREDD